MHVLVSGGGCTAQTLPGAGGRRAALRLPLGSPGWAGIGELRTCQVPSRSPFFANLLSDISPFHLLVIAQIVLSEEI